MRLYHIAKELGRPHRAVLQLMRELGYEVPSHMVSLTEEQETQLREAVERQERGAPTVRAVHTSSPSVSAAKVAEVVGTIDIAEDVSWEAPGSAAARTRKAPTTPAAPVAKGQKKKEKPHRPGIDREALRDRFSHEAELEGIDMVLGDDGEPDEDFIGPPLPPEGLIAETGVRMVDLGALEDKPAIPTRPRRERQSGPRRQVRTLTRRKRQGPKVSIQASQQLTCTVPITMKELSQVFGVRAQDMIRLMMKNTGQFGWNMNTVLDEEQVMILADEFERAVTISTELTGEEKLEEKLLEQVGEKSEGEGESRPPVVAILGHVDHGKTSLLDKIRSTNVVDGEHGGITQHIGAFQVQNAGGHVVTFLDTPGHAAFTAMRARGANAADIVVLVVAADDGIMPQTEEAITHAKVAGVPIVVAVNKIDKSNANPTKVKQQLSAHELTPEEWGGTTICCDVSAITGDGIDGLLESLALTAEMEELKAHPDAPARGRVIEARKDPARGVMCTVLVEDGTLRRGDYVIAGMGIGRVRRMQDDMGREVREAPPSTPVEVFGLADVPEAGDSFHAVKNRTLAKKAVEERKLRMRNSTIKDRPQVTLATLFGEDGAADVKELKVIIKADVRGSLEPLRTELGKLTHPEVKLDILYAGLGAVTQSDVDNAVAANAIIIGFHVLSEPLARRAAEREGVEIRPYMVIYDVIDDLRAAMERLLAPEKREEITGHAEIRQVFSSSKLGNLAGCYVIDGVVQRDGYIRLYRGGKLLYGANRPVQVDSLKRFKDDVKEVREGFECGMRISAYQDVQVGDVIEFYALREIQRSLSDQ